MTVQELITQLQSIDRPDAIVRVGHGYLSSGIISIEHPVEHKIWKSTGTVN